MAKLSFWKGPGVRTKDYSFIDKICLNYIEIGGANFYLHKFLGSESQLETPDSNSDEFGLLNISDLVNLEIRDRKYDPDVYELKGHTQVNDSEFDLKQFGMFLSSDTIFITFHRNQMVDVMGRRLSSGDVIEVLYMRDNITLDGKPINKFYVVEDGVSPAEGYSHSWWPHLWRVKCQPLVDSQEFQQILNQALDDRGDGIEASLNPDGTVATLQDYASTYASNIAINDAILAEAATNTPFRNFQASQYYVSAPVGNMPVNILVSAGIPPNGSNPVDSGTVFPTTALIGDFFLRMDFLPPVLYVKEATKWARVESNWRSEWLPAGAVLASFINNNNKATMTDGSVQPVKQAVSKAVKSRLDPDII